MPQLFLFRLTAAVFLLSLYACQGSDTHTPADTTAHLPLQRDNWCTNNNALTTINLTEPCDFGIQNPTRLLITTTDFATGAVSLLHLSDNTIDNDIALASTDSWPFYQDGMIYLVHRYGYDSIDVLQDNNNGIALSAQHPLHKAPEQNALNPHSIYLRPDGLAFVTVFEHTAVHMYDFNRPPEQAFVGEIDLSAFADADGRTETSLLLGCGDTLFVSAQRLNAQFMAEDKDLLIPIHMNTCSTYSNAASQTPQAIELQGTWVKQWRADPLDKQGHTALVLTSGIERVNLQTGAVSWAVPPHVFERQNLSYLHLMDFVVGPDSDTLFVLAARPDYTSVSLWRIDAADPSHIAITETVTDLQSIDRNMVLIGSQLWLANRNPEGHGLLAYDLNQSPPAHRFGPVNTGLAPYRVIALP